MAMSGILRPTVARTGFRAISSRGFSSSPIALIQASKASKDAVISPNETAGFKYVPGGPILPGTVNDATSFPHSNPVHGSQHWMFERVLSASLIPMVGAAAASGAGASSILDGILAVSLIVHSHIGFDSCVVDYVHTRKFPILGVVAKWALRGATGLSVWGVYEFITNDIGLIELVKKVWAA